MKMYSERDISYIIQDFLSQHFNFGFVELSADSLEILSKICEPYGIEVKNIIEND